MLWTYGVVAYVGVGVGHSNIHRQKNMGGNSLYNYLYIALNALADHC
jgi:predicted transporter